MSTHARFVVAVLVLTAPVIASMGPRPAGAAAPEGVDSDVQAALAALYKSTAAAKTLAATAKGILVFPNIVKAGFIVGAQYGEGELLKDGKIVGYYQIAAASYVCRPERRGSRMSCSS
jgi:lipid-binding SYLF domain-containing protein